MMKVLIEFDGKPTGKTSVRISSLTGKLLMGHLLAAAPGVAVLPNA